MKRPSRWIAASLLPVVLVSCQAGGGVERIPESTIAQSGSAPETSSGETGVRPSASDTSASSDVALAYTPPPIGTKWVWQSRGNRNSNGTFPATVVSHSETYRNQTAWKSTGDWGSTYRNVRDGSFIARTDESGRVNSVNYSKQEYLRFPLRVGDSWTTSWTGKRRNRSISQTGQVNVAAKETVRTGAGVFETYRIEVTGEGGANTRWRFTGWYYPKLGTMVKTDYRSQRFRNRGEMTSLVVPE